MEHKVWSVFGIFYFLRVISKLSILQKKITHKSIRIVRFAPEAKIMNFLFNLLKDFTCGAIFFIFQT